MFKQIVAIDVADYIDDFNDQAKRLSVRAPLLISDPGELSKIKDDLANVDALLVSIYQELKIEHLELLAGLRYIGVFGTSTAKIPLAYCQERAITIDSVTEYCDYETAEWVIGQIITHFRGLKPPKSVYEKCLGLIGVGGVGRQVLKVALALGMKVLFNATKTHPDLEKMGAIAATKKEIFSESDVVSFHTPPHMAWLGENDLQHTKFGALFINSCFGKISLSDDLDRFLEMRRDIILRMDSIAAASYQLNGRAILDEGAAYDTLDSAKRLVKLFLANASKAGA